MRELVLEQIRKRPGISSEELDAWYREVTEAGLPAAKHAEERWSAWRGSWFSDSGHARLELLERRGIVRGERRERNWQRTRWYYVAD